MGAGGLEPPQRCRLRILSPLRLPIPPCSLALPHRRSLPRLQPLNWVTAPAVRVVSRVIGRSTTPLLAVVVLCHAALAMPSLAATGTQAPDPAALRKRQREMIDQLEERWSLACQQLSTNREAISLEAAIRTGLLNNPILAKTWSDWQATTWQAIAIRREWSPSLTGNNPNPDALAYRNQRYYQSNTDTTTNKTTVTNTNQNMFYSAPRLQLNWTFLDPTRTPRLKATLQNQTAQQLLFDVSARSLVLDIQSAYFKLQELAFLRKDYARIYQLTRQQVRKAVALRRSGTGVQADVDQLRAQLLKQLVQMIAIYEQEVNAADQLAYTMSMEPGRLVTASDPMSLQGSWGDSLDRTIQEGLRMREEIKAAEAKADAFGWSSRAQLNRYLPNLAFLGQSSINTQDYSQSNVGLAGDPSSSYSSQLRNDLGLSFNWVFTNGGIYSAQAKALREQASASQADADLQKYLVTLQIQTSYVAFTSSMMTVDTALEQLKESRRSVDYTSQHYNGTTIDATTYIQNISNYLDAATSYSGAVRKYNIAIAGLYRYSARWPQLTQAEVQNRSNRLSMQNR